MEPSDDVPEQTVWSTLLIALITLRRHASTRCSGALRRAKRNGVQILGALVGGNLITQSAYGQAEGFAAVADQFCVGVIASVASTVYYAVGLGLIYFGLITFLSPKKDNSMSRGEARSNKMKGASMILLGIVSAAFPTILAGLGWVDLTGCISPGNVGG